MQTREETNTDASLRNTPLAVAARDGEEPKQTRMSQDLFPREVLREQVRTFCKSRSRRLGTDVNQIAATRFLQVRSSRGTRVNLADRRVVEIRQNKY